MKNQMHAMAIPTHATCMDTAIDCGIVSSLTEAKKVIRAAGHRIMTVGGSVDQYDAQDAPKIYGYNADGFGAISITVYP